MPPLTRSQRKSNRNHTSSSSSLSSDSSFIPAISTIAAAQIASSVGFTGAEPAALRSLSSILSLFIQTLSRIATSIAQSKNRTQSNILDLIRALEEIEIAQFGFPGGSNLKKPLLESSVLNNLRRFVLLNDEVPFAQPIVKNRRIEKNKRIVRDSSFEESGVEPPKHVPKWLPCFPNVGFLEDFSKREREFERRRWEEQCGVVVNLKECQGPNFIRKKEGMDGSVGEFRSGEERGRVSFKFLRDKTEDNFRRKMNCNLFDEDEGDIYKHYCTSSCGSNIVQQFKDSFPDNNKSGCKSWGVNEQSEIFHSSTLKAITGLYGEHVSDS